MNNFKCYGILLLTLCLFNCSKEELSSEEQIIQEKQTTTNVTQRAGLKPIGEGVMMQAFYWDVPAGGNWWNTVSSKVADWSNAGIDAIWLPPASKAHNGALSMGYDPFDYFDFGEYNQMGSTETRFGSRTELISLVNAAHQNQLSVIADIVINHNSGGDSEANPYTGGNTYTDYNPMSGMFYRSASDFHPNNILNNDTGVFGGFPDLSHSQPYVQDWLWKNSNSVAKYYRDVIGFDGWRFDYVKGFEPWVVKDWKNEVGGFSSRGVLGWQCRDIRLVEWSGRS